MSASCSRSDRSLVFIAMSFYPLTGCLCRICANFFILFPRPMCKDGWRAPVLSIIPMKSSDQHDDGIPSPSDITQWLTACKGDDSAALGKLLPLVYGELHRQAVRAFSRESAGHTLQPTALVNEVYLRLVNQDEMKWQNRAHFFALAAQMMRRILVSHARARKAAKRGGGDTCITLEEGVAAAPERDVNL